MTLGQFAVAVGASPRWVQNARAVLGSRDAYSREGAKHLGLARTISDCTGMPLVRAYGCAREALGAGPETREWALANEDGSVRVAVDLERYLSAFATRLSTAMTSYTERVRGRRAPRPRDALTAARAHGVDTTLFADSLSRTPAERLARLDQMSEFFRAARITGR
jgi:hypothetical protein